MRTVGAWSRNGRTARKFDFGNLPLVRPGPPDAGKGDKTMRTPFEMAVEPGPVDAGMWARAVATGAYYYIVSMAARRAGKITVVALATGEEYEVWPESMAPADGCMTYWQMVA